jgi:hypothetical protein
MVIEDLGEWKRLYLGPGCDATLLEVVTLSRGRRLEMAIHAMKMRPKYKRVLLGER